MHVIMLKNDHVLVVISSSLFLGNLELKLFNFIGSVRPWNSVVVAMRR